MKCIICENENSFTPLFPLYCKTENYLCLNCGLVFIPQEREFTREYYTKDGYFKKSPNLSLKKEFISPSFLVAQARKRFKLMLPLLSGITFQNKSVLDVGCGYGELLYYFKRKFNSKTIGIEPSSETAKLGASFYNVKIISKVLEEFKSYEKFDIILCNHTLEHVSDPVQFLLMLKSLLKPEGYLYIEVPNILKPTGGFSLNKFLYHEHLQTFSAYNINLLFNKVGLFTHEYSDKDFLRFVVRQSNGNGSKHLTKIDSQHIIVFLEKYRREYTFTSFIKVYFNKFKYLLFLIYYKINKDYKYYK